MGSRTGDIRENDAWVRVYGVIIVVTAGGSNLGVGDTGSHGDRGHELGLQL